MLGRYKTFSWSSLPGYGWTGITVAILAVATLITFAGTMLSATGMHQKQLNILLRDMDPERFISVYEPLLKKAGKRPNVQLTMLAYLSTAYANLGQYEKALELLDEALEKLIDDKYNGVV